MEDEQRLKAGALQRRNRPAEDGIATFGFMQLAVECGHRLPHDRMPQPQKHLMLLDPHHPAT